MNSTIPVKLQAKDKKVFLGLMLCVLLFIVFTILQDVLRSGIKNSAFYFSESLLFSSFWWFFAPLLFVQYYWVNHARSTPVIFKLMVMVLPAVIHLFAFPLLVWIISGLLYYHTYAFRQTFNYTLSEHVYNVAVLYTIPVALYQFVFTRSGAKTAPVQQQLSQESYLETIMVTDGNKKLPVAVAEVLYFTASPPYISIHTNEKKYLQQETLRSVLGKLDPAQFVRVHRSTIINIHMVRSYSTRLNGDYDLTMKNNMPLRLSRNYAAGFKMLFHQTHQLTAK
jgi:LytTr DNA-binding domain